MSYTAAPNMNTTLPQHGDLSQEIHSGTTLVTTLQITLRIPLFIPQSSHFCARIPSRVSPGILLLFLFFLLTVDLLASKHSVELNAATKYVPCIVISMQRI